MRAIRWASFGGPEVLTVDDIPVPQPGPAQVLLKVHASSVNPIDWKLAGGIMRPFGPKRPCTAGQDVSGEVVALGPDVTAFKVGDRAHARIAGQAGGAGAEFAVVGLDVLAPMPAAMTFEDAAAIPLAGMTALQGLRDRLGVPISGANQRVLVVGASGGVGHFAVQIARAAGAFVVGVCSGRNATLVSGLGANAIVDYTLADPYKGQEPFDAVLDCVAHDYGRYLPLLKPGGRYGSTAPGPGTFARMSLNPVSGKSVFPVMLKSAAADLVLLDELYVAGKLKVVIDSRFGLGQMAEAWKRSISGRSTGKIVVDVLTEGGGASG